MPKDTEIADKIGQFGTQRDTALQDIGRGIADGLRGLAQVTEMLKARHQEPDGDEGMGDDYGDDDGDEDEDEGEGDEKAMRQRVGAQDLQKGKDQYLDVTDFVLGMQSDIRDLRKGLGRALSDNEALRKELALQTRASEAMIKALQAALPQIDALHKALPAQVAVAAPVVARDAAASKFPAAQSFKAAADGDRIPQAKLVKAFTSGVLSETMLSRYQQTGVFSADAEQHREVLAKVSAV